MEQQVLSCVSRIFFLFFIVEKIYFAVCGKLNFVDCVGGLCALSVLLGLSLGDCRNA